MPVVAAAVAPELLAGIGGEAAAGGVASGAGGAAGGLGSMLSGLGGGGSGLLKGGMGLATSLIQNLSANKAKKNANSLMPGQVDPRQAQFLAELNQKRKAIDTGADFGTGMNAINGTNASTNEALTRASGGDVGATIQGLLGSQRTANDGQNNVLAQGQQQQMGYNSMFNELNNKIAARSMQIQMQKSQQARAEWAQKKQSANQNGMAGAANLLSGIVPKDLSTMTDSQGQGFNAFDTGSGGNTLNSIGAGSNPLPTNDMNPGLAGDASFLNNIVSK